MQGIVDTLASWFGFLGDIIGYSFDLMIIFIFGLAGAFFVTFRNLLYWFVENCWESIRQSLAAGVVTTLDKLGVFPDVETDDIEYWLEVANRILPLSEALAWLEGYWAFKLAQWSWNAIKRLMPW